jgi:hypothetical protein
MAPATAPQAPRKPRRDGWTAERRRQFLDGLAAGLDVKRACARVGMSRQKAYTLRGRDADFARAWDEARRAARAGADEAFLALLPERLRVAMSELPGAGESRPLEMNSRTVSGLSGSCHLKGDRVLPLDRVPSVPSMSPSPRAGVPDWPQPMLVTLNSVQGPSLHTYGRSGRRDEC